MFEDLVCYLLNLQTILPYLQKNMNEFRLIFIHNFHKTIFTIVSLCLLNSVISANILNRENILKKQSESVELSQIWELGSIKQAVASFKQTADYWETLKEPANAASCLNEAAKLSQMISDYKTAFQDLDKAIKLETKFNLLEERVISSSLFSLISRQKGDRKNSQKYSEEALFFSEKTSSDQAKAYALFSSGMYEYYYGKMENATPSFEQASIYAQQTQDIFLKSQLLFYVSFSYFREGNFNKAVDKMNLALMQSEKYYYRKGVALSYFGLAYISYFLNEKQKALDLFKKSNSMFPADFEWMEKARIVNAIGNIYLDLRELDLAESNFRQAIVYYDKVNYPAGKVTTLTTLADTFVLKNKLSEAADTYNSAKKLSLEIEDKFRLALIDEGLGNIEFKKSNYDNAIKNYLESLKIYNEIGIKLPNVENLLGDSYLKKNELGMARHYYNSALLHNQKTKDFIQLSETLYKISKLDLMENDTYAALNQVEKSVNLTESLYIDVVNAKLKSAYLANTFERYELYINLLMKTYQQSLGGNFAIKALQAAEKSKARSIIENLSLSKAEFFRDATPEVVKREKELRIVLNAKADNLTDLLSQNADKSETDTLDDEINELNNELETIKSDLKQNSPIYSAIKNPAPFDVAEFQRNVLDENSLLLEFSFGKEESYLWLVSKTEVNSYILPPREQIESRIERLRKLIDSRGMLEGETVESYQARVSEAENTYKLESKQLSDELFGQAADKLSNKRLIIVPDGKLHYFPVAALPRPNSADDTPILLTNEVVYEPSAATLTLLMRNGLKTSAATKNLLVFSDPIFSDQDARIANAGNANEIQPDDNSLKVEKFRFAESLTSLVRLNASKDEADSIVDIVGAADSTTLSGAAATRERALDASIADYKIVHFATHGLIKEDRPELSGIVLSQVDENGQATNGVVRLQDIYAMNLSADAVILSACSTGIGKEVKGEGLMSLNNAFLQTGAKSVVSSLWKVDDYAAQELMKHFYRELATGNVTTSEALRRAQIKLRQNPQYQSPFYWAAFTVQGDYKTIPQLSKSFDYRIFGLLIFPFALLGIYFYRRRLN